MSTVLWIISALFMVAAIVVMINGKSTQHIQRAEKYSEWSTPLGGMVPVLFVDVQHDRLAVTCWVVGRGEEMWLAFWGELYGQTVVAHQGAWIELEQMLMRTVRHASGAALHIAICGIDCSDGQTSDAAYSFVRKHNRHGRPVLATKGASDDEGRVEIWTPPKAIDPNHKSTKASKYGVQIHIIGVAKAKDLILGWATESGRVRLAGNGAGRMHWYENVRADFYEQLLSEIKVPMRANPKRRKWKARTDRRNEVLDCTVGALYLSRHLRLHLRRPGQWDLEEMRLRQVGLLPDDAPAPMLEPEEDRDEAPVQTSAQEPVEVETVGAPDVTEQLAAVRFKTLLKNRKAQRHGR